MRLCRAVPKIPAKSSVPPRLPLHKNRILPTASKSTLPQLLIPLRFKSRISNVYKKTEGERLISCSKVLQLVTPLWTSKECAPESSTGLPLPLFSYSYALFCTAPSAKPFAINCFRTLYKKRPGWGTPLNRKSPPQFRFLNGRPPRWVFSLPNDLHIPLLLSPVLPSSPNPGATLA